MQPLLLTFCSQADEDYVELWLVRNLRVAATSAPNLHEVTVTARRLYTSDRAFSSDDFPVPEENWTFHEAEGPRYVVAGIDLAYVYVHGASGAFHCLAKALGLPCEVGVETIRLPNRVMDDISERRGARFHTELWPLEAAFRRLGHPCR